MNNNLSKQESLTRLWLVPKVGPNKVYLSRVDRDKISAREGINALISGVLEGTQKGKYQKAYFYDNSTNELLGKYVNGRYIENKPMSGEGLSLTKMRVYFPGGACADYYSDGWYDEKSQVNGIRRLIRNVLEGTMAQKYQTAIFYDQNSDKIAAKYVKGKKVYQNRDIISAEL